MKTSEDLDLGIVPSKEKDCVPSPCCAPEDKPRYPELTFRGDHAKLFREKYGSCAPGDEYTITMKLTVKSSSAGESDYDNRIEFNCTKIVGDVVEEETEEEKPKKSATRKLGKTY